MLTAFPSKQRPLHRRLLLSFTAAHALQLQIFLHDQLIFRVAVGVNRDEEILAFVVRVLYFDGDGLRLKAFSRIGFEQAQHLLQRQGVIEPLLFIFLVQNDRRAVVTDLCVTALATVVMMVKELVISPVLLAQYPRSPCTLKLESRFTSAHAHPKPFHKQFDINNLYNRPHIRQK